MRVHTRMSRVVSNGDDWRRNKSVLITNRIQSKKKKENKKYEKKRRRKWINE